MDLQGSHPIDATPQQVWEAMNDPAVLMACIPGCDTCNATAAGVFEVSAAFKIGLLAARFGGTIALTDVEPPHRYTIHVEGRGAVGFGRGRARVVLVEAVAPRTGCTLQYTLQVDVGGKVAQVAGRWLGSTAEALVGKFFLRFDKALQQRLREQG